MSAPVPVLTDEEAIAEILLLHGRVGGIRDIRARCVCGWSSEVMADRLAAHRTHVASILAARVGDAHRAGGVEAMGWLVTDFRAKAGIEFSNKGPHDPRGAAIWDCASWIAARANQTEGKK